jgi:hypothetical protein
LLLAAVSHGQTATEVNNGESKPVPGVGHDYIGMLNETVNPANGSLDITVALPVPHSRGITIPFAIAYNSNGTFHLQPSPPGMSSEPDAAYLSMNGWSYAVPLLSYYKTFKTARTGTMLDGQPSY